MKARGAKFRKGLKCVNDKYLKELCVFAPLQFKINGGPLTV